ncbi:MAG: UDP-N-acetylmuramoyl-L-alanyl-D-glutamate--2,6-diaminopimelate ligase [Dehalococcoidia bacterium]|jgi:UDP-N-acetylmuramoyl-L-alanyl-D-glutamate--2,6-diaminopimelate ligase|uniref:UDP-N-acetylmuramoyl-L-alanyl-D-glutamate--2, 6-diaminopimelate ligase n=1 Tax=Candidatus Amarobacter glycogenicus TaxID=3140699 RepID=UPI003135CB72|nr:UDP-N-acetylmuramoyl-L-alanyl-D-glutamate--2,6-diaminopimelate ligase [Dehalococcoidia bacterium]MBK7125731.1 UDP-N-acetylmuramoyl-L-alanyl-D-glutamate--2,6-diaminopimelate ligase [Dehalococcoidia bacterium]MBK7328615.1 UDP-N-acetylmuramoyl-L-alanyl-D-glutamate--2,6-diaminopimelate ligase [Dehalococcoidia bacterium]MBK8559305.1 UDP-N-acetylmuramoyl-L-alanyl-D-glutamate--2,6-diaminopimelate ligase [Dehalococcoidia bacterium]MBK9545773.1 UDP-N-acetylmuramoyl-L-alanyl-D-glutamate--2,6-diaminopi
MTKPADRTLGSLVAEVPGARLVRGSPDTVVQALEYDSRQAKQGSLFIAVPGFVTDGHTYLPQVAAAGAAAAIVQADHVDSLLVLPETLALVSVPATRPAQASAAAWFYGHPGREMVVIGVTGTDGKTTTSHLLTSVLEAAGGRVGRLGTVDTYFPGESGKVTDRMTSPEAPEVQRLLRRFADAGCEFAIVESTSHGLALHRMDHVEYDVAVFTNITGDHLDFHKTFDAYREAKGLLFAALDSATDKGVAKAAVVNADDPSANAMLWRTSALPIRFGLESREAEVTARNIVLRADGSDFRLETPQGRADASIALPALFNVMNALAAAGAGVACGASVQEIARGLTEAPGVPGRMERIVAGQPFEVIVDYAHTGDAVRKVLEVLRAVCKGQLIVVVGAAGERDPGRRFGVGRAAAEGADFSVFTNEDPRSEDPTAIVREIGRHAEGAGKTRGSDFIEVEDRREAIAAALERARAGDIVVILGKGHEKSMIYGLQSVPWDDRDVTREELGRLGHAG